MIYGQSTRLWVAAVVSLACYAPPADAARRVAVQHGCAACTTAAVIQPAYNATPYVAATYNFVGAPVRLQAEQAYTMQNDPQWQAFQQFKAEQQVQAMAQQLFQQWQQQAAQEPAQSPGAGQQLPAQPPTELPAQPPAPGPLPPPDAPPHVAQPSATPYAAQIPTIVALCSKCHSGQNAKGDLWLDGSADIRADGNEEDRDAIMKSIVRQTMPKGSTLTPDEAGQIVVELFAE